MYFRGSWTVPTPPMPPAEKRSALKGRHRAGGAQGPRYHLLVATDHEVELCDNTVALFADVTQCLAPATMILSREGWEG